MNIDAINKTIDLIKLDQSLQFNMKCYMDFTDDQGKSFEDALDESYDNPDMPKVVETHFCKTACCLAGYAYIAEGGTVPSPGSADDIDFLGEGMNILDIDYNTACQLFAPDGANIRNNNKDDAIKVLEALRDTGKVIWPEIKTMDV